MASPDPDDVFVQKVERKSARLLRARRARLDPVHGMLVAIGIGWSVALPAAGFGLLGAWTGRHLGVRQAPLLGVGVGLVLGVYAAYRQVRRALSDDDPPSPDEPPTNNDQEQP